MKNSIVKQPTSKEIERESIDQLKEKLNLQNSAIKKLNALMEKSKQGALFIFMLCTYSVFSQTGDMTWINGSKSADAAGIYGTQGLQPHQVSPGSRKGMAKAEDADGNIWIFGGTGLDANGQEGKLCDLWKWDGKSWSWISGLSTKDQLGVYGTKKSAASANRPGSRESASCWVDANGDFWLFGGFGYGTTYSGHLNDMWKWNGTKWAWWGGENTVNQKGVYGTMTVSSLSNTPGARKGAAVWTDNYTLYLFGGSGYDKLGYGHLNDMWKWTGATWTWISGADTVLSPSVSPSKGVAAPGNSPSARESCTYWTDNNGDHWLFGGYCFKFGNGSTSHDYYNDVWKFDGSYWAWISGSGNPNENGNYGTINIPSTSNRAGGRAGATAVKHTDGYITLFGGYGYDGASASKGRLNDLWLISGNSWTWKSGDSTRNSAGKSGTKGITVSTNLPRSRTGAISWYQNGNFHLFGGNTHSFNEQNDIWKWDGGDWTWIFGAANGKVKGKYGLLGGIAARNPGGRKAPAMCKASDGSAWLYGGEGYDENGVNGYLSDLWKLDGETNLWTWIKGSNSVNDTAVYGTVRVSNSANTPGRREGAVMWSENGKFWLFGGKYESAGNTYYLNDLWKYDGSKWKWMDGDTAKNQPGVYSGTNLNPGARLDACAWVDANGDLWLFGGRGMDKDGNLGRLNDFWKYDGTEWTFIKGSDTKNPATVYGAKGVAATTNTPGGRASASYWKGNDGHFWIFGGDGYDANANYGSFNDVWKWDGSNWTWVAGDNTKNLKGIYGLKYKTADSNRVGARKSALAWVGDLGSIWVYSGYGRDKDGQTGRLNDLWVYRNNEWTWVSGSKTRDANSNHGSKGVQNASYISGARSNGVAFYHNKTAYVFGGHSRDKNGNAGSFNDFWAIDVPYQIDNSTFKAMSLGELGISSGNATGNALQNAGDYIRTMGSSGQFVTTTDNLPGNSPAAQRYSKVWTLETVDINENGGNAELTFDLGQPVNKDYSYYLLRKSQSNNLFYPRNDVDYKIVGNTVVFSIGLDALTTGYGYTLGISTEGAGHALDFTTSDDRVELPVTLNISQSDFTIEGWFNISDSIAAGAILFQEDGTGTGTEILGLRNSKLYAKLGWTTFNGSTKILANKWNHYAITQNGISVKLYLNGYLEASGSVNKRHANGKWYLGQENGGSDHFVGKIDELRIWNTARKPQDLFKNMHQPLNGDEVGLLAYYKFDQNSGLSLPDVSGNTNRGELIDFSGAGSSSNWVISDAPIFGKAMAKNLTGPGNALLFDGTNDIVTTTLDVQPSALATTTWEAWIYPTRLNHSSYQAVFSNDDGGYDRFVMIKSGSNKFVVSKGNGFFEPDYEITANEWMHIAVVYKNGNILFYANGIRYEHGSAEILTASSRYFSIGGIAGAGYDFKGKIDDVRVWSDERSQTEIQDNMYASLDADEDGLVAYYDFDHASGSTLQDQSGNSKTGTLSGFSGTYWVSASDREPFKTAKAGSHSANTTWKGGTAPSSTTDKLAVFHDLTLGSTGTYSRLHVNSGQTITTNADITVSGEIIINGTAGGTNKIIMSGSAKQSLGGSGTMAALQVNNSNDVSLEGDITISGALTLTSGDIEVNNHTLTLTGTTSHGSASSYLKINGNGKVKTTVGSDPVILPIGRNPYLPIIIDDGGGAEFTVGVSDKVYNNPTTNSTELTSEVVTETWTIQASQAATNVIVQLGWDAAEESSLTRTASGIGYWQNGVSSSWSRPALTSAATGSDPYFQTRTMDFSTNLYYLGVGGPGSALPVELTHFTAQWQEVGTERSRSAQLTWQTAMEENNSHFEVERKFSTLSGVEGSWEQVARVEGAGNSISPIDYSYTDKSPSIAREGFRMGQTIYYRLKQVDFNGEFEYSKVQSLEMDAESGIKISIYPNPANSSVNLISSKLIDRVQILDLQGKLLINQRTPAQLLDISALPIGTYLVQVHSGTEVSTQKLRVH